MLWEAFIGKVLVLVGWPIFGYIIGESRNHQPIERVQFLHKQRDARGKVGLLPQQSHSTKSTSLNAFSNRVVSDWNALPRDVVSANTTNGFKNKLDDHWKEERFENPFE